MEDIEITHERKRNIEKKALAYLRGEWEIKIPCRESWRRRVKKMGVLKETNKNIVVTEDQT